MKKPCCWSILLASLFSLVFSPLYLYADRDIVEVVETEGTSAVYGGDRAPARESAIADSMQRAVKHVVGMLVSEDVAAAYAEVLDNNIYPKYKDYMRDYRILQEDMEGGVYRVRVRVTLSVMDLRRDLEKMDILTVEWRPEEEQAGVTVQVVVRGIEEYACLRVLRETLERDIRGVDAVRLRRMGSGVAVLDVEMQGDTSMLAKALELKEFGAFSLYVNRVTHDSIEFNMTKE